MDGRARGTLPRLGPQFNQHAYMELLQEVRPQLRLMRPVPIRFQQDNSPVHTARAVRAMLPEEDVEMAPWVVRGPDISPIENLLPPQLRDRRFNADWLWLAVDLHIIVCPPSWDLPVADMTKLIL